MGSLLEQRLDRMEEMLLALIEMNVTNPPERLEGTALEHFNKLREKARAECERRRREGTSASGLDSPVLTRVEDTEASGERLPVTQPLEWEAAGDKATAISLAYSVGPNDHDGVAQEEALYTIATIQVGSMQRYAASLATDGLSEIPEFSGVSFPTMEAAKAFCQQREEEGLVAQRSTKKAKK